MDIGRVGIWTFSLDLQPATRAQEAADPRLKLLLGAESLVRRASHDADAAVRMALDGWNSPDPKASLTCEWGPRQQAVRYTLALSSGAKLCWEAPPLIEMYSMDNVELTRAGV